MSDDLNARNVFLGSGDTCRATGRTYLELDYFNIGTNARDEWAPFVSESAYVRWMKENGRYIPDFQGS